MQPCFLTAPRSSKLSFRTCKCRVYKLEKALTILSASNKDAGLIFGGELRALSVEKKEQLLCEVCHYIHA